MADVKWIKIVTDIFDDEKILLIESMPDADSIIVIWFKLLCLAGKQNNGGVFLLNNRIPFTDEMFATIFRRSVNTVRLALSTFEQFGMIEMMDSTVCIPKWGVYQKLDALEQSREKTRLRVAAYRARQRMLMDSNVCQYCGGQATGYDHVIAIARGGEDTDDNKVPCCIECNRIKNDKPLVDFLNNNRDRINDEIVTANPILKRYVTLSNVTGRYEVTASNAYRIDKNRIDKNRIDKNSNSNSDDSIDFDTIEAYVTANIDRLTPGNMQELESFKDDMPDELIRYAVDEAVANSVRSWAYVRKILNAILDKGFKTVGEAKAAADRKRQQKAPQQPQYDDTNPALRAKFY